MGQEDQYIFKLLDESGREKYGAVRQIGEGGMGEVFEGHGLGKHNKNVRVAIKKIHRDVALDVAFQKRFFDELNTTQVLNHPNIVTIRDSLHSDDSGNFYMILEYIDGVTLKRFLEYHQETSEKISHETALYIVQEICKGLDYAHNAVDAKGRPLNIVHRDISLNNVMLTYHGGVKIIDFGIARKSIEERFSDTTILGPFGKRIYMAPEQFHGGAVDARSDIFSTGVLAFELFTSRMLPKRIQLQQDLEQIEDVDLKRILLTAIKEAPDARFATAGDMQNALRQYYALYMQRNQLFSPFPEENLKTMLTDIRPKVRVRMNGTAKRKTKVIDTHIVYFEVAAESSDAPDMRAQPRRLNKAMLSWGDAANTLKSEMFKLQKSIEIALQKLKTSMFWRYATRFGGIYLTLLLLILATRFGMGSDIANMSYLIKTNVPGTVFINGEYFGSTPVRFRVNHKLPKHEIILSAPGCYSDTLGLQDFTDNSLFYVFEARRKTLLTIGTNLANPKFWINEEPVASDSGVCIDSLASRDFTVRIAGADSTISDFAAFEEIGDSIAPIQSDSLVKWAVIKNSEESLKLSATFYRERIVRSEPLALLIAEYDGQAPDTLGPADGTVYAFPIGKKVKLNASKKGYISYSESFFVEENQPLPELDVLLEKYVRLRVKDRAGNLVDYEIVKRKRNGGVYVENGYQSRLSVDEFEAYLRGDTTFFLEKPKRIRVRDGETLTIAFPNHFYKDILISPGIEDSLFILDSVNSGNKFAMYDSDSKRMIFGGRILYHERDFVITNQEERVNKMGVRIDLLQNEEYKLGFEGEANGPHKRSGIVGHVTVNPDGSLKHVMPGPWQNANNAYRLITSGRNRNDEWFLFPVNRK